MRRSSLRAFTLIELLTVIAIIALLAAILLPTLFRVKQDVNQTTCMSNMHELYVKANIFKEDNGEYPALLFGYAQDAAGQPWNPSSGTPPVAMGSAKNSFLFPKYISDIQKFHCPSNQDRDLRKGVVASFPASSPWAAIADPVVFDPARSGFKINVPAAFANSPIPFYAYDSYDISSYLQAAGTRRGSDYQIVYARDWTAARPQNVDTRQDSPNQLQYARSMPLDKTILTWCNYHVTTSKGEKCPVIFATGQAKTIDYKQMVQAGWNLRTQYPQ